MTILSSSLFQEILEDPNNIESRLVFADWMDELGSPMGEFIRLQLQITEILDSKNLSICYTRRHPQFRIRDIENDQLMRWCEVEKLDESLAKLVEQSENMFAQYGRTWNGPLHKYLNQHGLHARSRRSPLRGWKYERGFVEHIMVNAHGLPENTREIFRIGPVRKITMYDCYFTYELVRKLLEDSMLDRVESFFLHQTA